MVLMGRDSIIIRAPLDHMPQLTKVSIASDPLDFVSIPETQVRHQLGAPGAGAEDIGGAGPVGHRQAVISEHRVDQANPVLALAPPGGLGAAATTRRRERQERIRLVDSVLGYYHLTVADWAGASYVLGTRTGRTELVANLSELWTAAEDLAGAACDPLDDRLLDHLARVPPRSGAKP